MLPSQCLYLCILCSRLLGRAQAWLQVIIAQPLTNSRLTRSTVHELRRGTGNPFVIYSLRPVSSNPCRVATICTTTLLSDAADHSKGCQFP
jgi:hypothetical protein